MPLNTANLHPTAPFADQLDKVAAAICLIHSKHTVGYNRSDDVVEHYLATALAGMKILDMDAAIHDCAANLGEVASLADIEVNEDHAVLLVNFCLH